MTAPSPHTQTPPSRVILTLQINTPKGGASSGPTTRTLIIPAHDSVLIGRASTSLHKNRAPAEDNALFTCAVMSRSHAYLSTPDGSDGPIILEDADSMHGVYVNGKKATRTNISLNDDITFGSKVTRAEGEFLSSNQAFNFDEYPLLTPLPATHDGVQLKVVKITRAGSTMSNPIDLVASSRTVPHASYRVPDYDTDSSKEDSTSATFRHPVIFEPPTAVEYIDLDSASSPASSHDFVHPEDDFDAEVYHNGSYSDSDFNSEFDSDYEANDYPENPDEFDDDDQSVSGSDCSESHCSSRHATSEEDMHDDGVSVDLEEPFESHEEPQTAPARVNNIEVVQPKATYSQVEAKEKARETAGIMSLPWILEPCDHFDTTFVASPPKAVMPREVPPPPVCENMKNIVEAGLGTQNEEKHLESQAETLESHQLGTESDNITGTKTEEEKEGAASVPTFDEPFAEVDSLLDSAKPLTDSANSPAGSKRKRDIEDDGQEEVVAPTSLADRNMLKKLRWSSIVKQHAQTAPRPIKRAKRSTARFALGAFAGAIGGVATVVGVLMTPACEQLLSSWPME